MRRNAYPKYKPSGVEWLGEIPEPWDILGCKFGYSIQLGKMLQNDPQTVKDELVPYLKAFHVNWEKVKASDLPEMWASPGDIRKYSVREGDLLVCEGGEGGRAGILKDPPLKCIIQNALHRVRPRKDNDNQFLMYLLEVVSHRGWFDILCNKATIAHFTAEKFGWLSIILPPSYEQRTIAAFLDRETARIDALMEKKQRQIELLKEKRAALISHAVTKGLDPTVPLKDSEVEWLGQIPAHWEIMKLKYLVEGGLINGLFKKKEFFGSGVKLVNVFDVYRKDFLIDHTSLDLVEADQVEQSKYAVRSGDIFFVRSSLKLEGVGRSVCALDIGEPTVFECHVVRGRPIQQKISPKFLIHFLNSIYVINRFISLANLVTMATIDQDKIKSLEVSLPPRDEQDKIMAFLDRETETMEKLEKSITKSIEKLKEYRTALISAAVTGKIDVRGQGT